MDPHTPKVAIPFVSRARELSRRDPVMAYWCKFMAAKVALDQLDSLDDDGRNALETIMGDLEESKAALANNELVTDDAAGSAYIYNFASRVFESADAADRAGKATRATAKEFLAASNFFETLAIFGPLETDVSEKITYAKWKASSIAKAFREGRTPTPGPAGGPAILQQPAEVDAAFTNDSSEDVASQLGRPTSSSANSISRSRSQQGDTTGTGAQPSNNVIDLSEDNEEPTAFSLPPPPSGDVCSTSNSFPSAPTDIGDEDTSPFPSVPPSISGAGNASSSRAPSHPSAPPEVPFFPSASHDFQDEPPHPSSPPLTSKTFRPSQTQSSAPTAPPTSSYSYSNQSRDRQSSSATNNSQSGMTSYGTDTYTTNAKSSNDDDDEWRPAPSSLDATTIATAQKHAKWAISALNYEDAETARKELRKALELIGG